VDTAQVLTGGTVAAVEQILQLDKVL